MARAGTRTACLQWLAPTRMRIDFNDLYLCMFNFMKFANTRINFDNYIIDHEINSWSSERKRVSLIMNVNINTCKLVLNANVQLPIRSKLSGSEHRGSLEHIDELGDGIGVKVIVISDGLLERRKQFNPCFALRDRGILVWLIEPAVHDQRA
jgi:hypothetical protein